MSDHVDALAALSLDGPLSSKLQVLHRLVRGRIPAVERIAVVTLDHATSTLRTFIDSTDGPPLLVHYETPLGSAPSLCDILRTGRPRVVNDLQAFSTSESPHAREVRARYRSSYTLPIAFNGQPCGFVFFDAAVPGAFTEDVLPLLDLIAHVIEAFTTQEILLVRALLAAVRTATKAARAQDPTLGAHLDRLFGFSKLIAQELHDAWKYRLSGADVERVAAIGALHATGEHGPPVHLFLPPGSPEYAEYLQLKLPSMKGLKRIHALLREFFQDPFPSFDVIQSVTRSHFEAADGVWRGEAGPPLESRIVAVADVFDTFTARRSERTARSAEEVFALLARHAGTEVDRDCVAALARNPEKIRDIRARSRTGYVGLD